MEEVAGSIERINNEPRLSFSASDLATFFHQESPVGTCDFEFTENRVFSTLISFRNEIRRPLLRNLQMFDLTKIAAKLATSFTGSFFHDGQ